MNQTTRYISFLEDRISKQDKTIDQLNKMIEMFNERISELEKMNSDLNNENAFLKQKIQHNIDTTPRTPIDPVDYPIHNHEWWKPPYQITCDSKSKIIKISQNNETDHIKTTVYNIK